MQHTSLLETLINRVRVSVETVMVNHQFDQPEKVHELRSILFKSVIDMVMIMIILLLLHH